MPNAPLQLKHVRKWLTIWLSWCLRNNVVTLSKLVLHPSPILLHMLLILCNCDCSIVVDLHSLYRVSITVCFSGSTLPFPSLSQLMAVQSKVEHDCWLEKVRDAAHDSQRMLLNGPKAMRKTSTDDFVTASRPRNLRQMHSVPPTGSTSVHALKD